MGWRVDHDGYHEGGRANPLYKSAKELHEMVKSGEARADMTRAVDPEGAVQPGAPVDEEDAPEY